MLTAGLAKLRAVFGLERRPRQRKLARSDEQFHAAYDQLRAAAAREAPTLVLLGDELVLFDGEQRHSYQIERLQSEIIKQTAHAPVGIFVVLQTRVASADGSLDEPSARRLSILASARSDAALAVLGPDVEADVAHVLDCCHVFVKRVLGNKRVTSEELSRFAADLGPWLLRLSDHATHFELDALHSAVERALRELPDERRPLLEVVVAGAHQARARSLGLQYFQNRFAEQPGEERRVVYAESTNDVLQARELIGTRRLDRAVAQAFFHDPTRLQRDVLGDSALRQLERSTFTRIV